MATMFVEWFFIDAPRSYLHFLREVSIALYNYFSISLHFLTLFHSWRHDAVDLTKLPIRFWFQAIISNAVSKMIGFILRSIVIFTGIVTIILFNTSAVVFIVGWYLMPLLLFYSILFGIGLITRGA